jgi:hypothetical protein
MRKLLLFVVAVIFMSRSLGCARVLHLVRCVASCSSLSVSFLNVLTFKFNKCLHVRLKIDRNKWKSATGCYNTILLFSACCCNTYKSQIGAEYTEVFRCFHSQKSRWLRSGDGAGQVTGPPHRVHCPPKVSCRCCLRMQSKWGGAPPCMNHSCCPYQEVHVPRVPVNHSPHNGGTLHLLVC